MMVFSALYVVWAIRLLINLSTYIQLWYVKEYRFDRMAIHLRSNQGKRIWFPSFRRPPVTLKTACVFAGVIIVELAVYSFAPFSVLWRFLAMDVLLFPLTALFVAVFKAPTLLYHFWVIRRARQLLGAHSAMHVVGITGSYGKTSTKEYLASILGTKYETLKTEASKNSPIGISEVVLRKLHHAYYAFVVEMGAYKPGEIAEMCELVRPEIGILTAINPQHQDLFGSIEQTVKAKYELVSGLHGKKVVIVNYDNTFTRQMGENAKKDGCTVIYYSVAKQTDWYATDIVQQERGVKFTAHHGKHEHDVTVPLIGVFHVSNILAAMAAAFQLGLLFDEVVTGCSAITSLPKTMQPVVTALPALCIDDTFNNNPDAAVAAISFLKEKKGKKILVFQPMIELGAYASSSHEKVGEYAARVCDTVLLTNDSYLADFTRGMKKVHSNLEPMVVSHESAAAYLKTHTSAGDTVLFKGKESGRVLALVR